MADPKKENLSALEREVVGFLIQTKAVNFEAIGAAFAKFGPSAADRFDGEDIFCLTMRRFIRVFRPGLERQGLEQLGALRKVSKEF